MVPRVRSLALPVSLAALVFLAGCLGGLGGLDVDSSGGPDVGSTGDTATASTATAAPAQTDAGPTATPTTSPWGTEPIVVAIEGPPDRDVAPLVRTATAFWEERSTRYAGYAVDYEVRPDASNPDMVIEFMDEIASCERVDHTAGCAPYITQAGQIDRPVKVEIKNGLSDDSTVRVVEHELGHTLGLGHDDEPQSVMQTGVQLTTLPQPNATERAYPWQDDEFTVYVDVEESDDPAAARRQVRAALDYYERGAPGMPDNLTFEVVDDPDADIVVEYRTSSPCSEGPGSCGSSRGPDPDGDGASEYYSQFTVSVVGLDTDAVAWHTGYWLASAFGAEDEREKPDVFRDATYEERRSEWWK